MTIDNDYLARGLSLEGLQVLIIGGAGELGKAFAVPISKAGGIPWITARSKEKCLASVEELKAAGAKNVQYHVCDTSKTEQIEATFSAMEKAGEVFGFIYAAGINSATPFEEIDDEEAARIMDANYHGARRVMQRYLASEKRTEGKGSVVLITSASAGNPLSKVVTYSHSKSALLGMAWNLAATYGAENIRVNALSPGFFPAEQNAKVLTKERVEDITSHTALGRMGKPEELAFPILLMLSPAAGSFITGQHWRVDGGFNITGLMATA